MRCLWKQFRGGSSPPSRTGRVRIAVHTLSCILVAALSCACGPNVDDAPARLAASLEQGPGASDFVDLVGKSWAGFFILCQEDRDCRPLISGLKSLAGTARPVQSIDGLFQAMDTSETIFFVRDGWGVRFRPGLSGGIFSGLWEISYPSL